MQSISVFLDITKFADFRWKNADVSRTQWLCHVIDIFFGSSLGKCYCAKFHHCRICVTDFREGAFLPPHPWAAPKMPIMNRVKTNCPGLMTSSKQGNATSSDKTRKIIGIKSQWLNCSDITQVNIKSKISTAVSKVNILSYSVVFIKKINLLRLSHWCFPGKFMNFSEAATGGDLWKKLFLKISQYSQESCRPATFLKTDRCFPLKIAKFLRTPISKNICSVSSCFCIDSFIKFR